MLKKIFKLKNCICYMLVTCMIFTMGTKASAEGNTFTSNDTGFAYKANRQGAPQKLEKAGDGTVRYYEWLSSGGNLNNLRLSINTFNGASGAKSRSVKSKNFKKINEPLYDFVYQDKKGNVYGIHNTKKESRLFHKKEKSMNEYMFIYDKNGNVKSKLKITKHNYSQNVTMHDIMIKGNKIYVAFEKGNYKKGKYSLYINVYNKKTGKQLSQKTHILKAHNRYNKVKYSDSGLYILLGDRIERYSIDGKKLKGTYMLPNNNKKTAKVNGSMQKWDNNNYNPDVSTYNKEEFSISGNNIYYCNADGLYSTHINAGSAFSLLFDAVNDAYFAGEYSFFDMVYTDADTFYILMTNYAEGEEPTHIIRYSRS
ncbi:MAG: hypothetical protein HFH14_09975 [Lachnospiraceae bacterium]|nr:hypothetical protein [Lachnospiraceae bacterium]